MRDEAGRDHAPRASGQGQLGGGRFGLFVDGTPGEMALHPQYVCLLYEKKNLREDKANAIIQMSNPCNTILIKTVNDTSPWVYRRRLSPALPGSWREQNSMLPLGL